MDKAMEFIEQLAAKLGVAVEYLWSTLVRQQIAEGITDVVMAVLAVVTLVYIAKVTPGFKKTADEKYKALADDRRKNGTGYAGSHVISSFEEDKWQARGTTITVFAIVAAIIAVIIILVCVPVGIQQLINPEYFALKEVLNAIGGV